MLTFINENNSPFDPIKENYESYEIQTILKYLPKNASVLELGGRLGVVSNYINQQLENKKTHIVVEPCEKYSKALFENRKLNNAEYSIIQGVISNQPLKYISGDWADNTIPCSIEEMNIDCYSYEDALKLLPKNTNRFDHLIVDCEGAFERFLKENMFHLPTWRSVFIEYDCREICNYTYIEDILCSNGFTKIPISIIHNIFLRK